MIVDTSYLRNMRTIYRRELIDAPYVQMVAGWCVDYYEKYEQAPGRYIEDIYRAKTRKNELDEELADSIQDYMNGLSEEYEPEKFNSSYLLDTTAEHFRVKALKNLTEDVREGLRSGASISEIESVIVNYHKPEHRPTLGIDVLNDMEAIQTAWESAGEPLFEAPGALGEMINRYLCRDSLIGIQAPEKRGKTFWLFELATWAYFQGCNVAIFQAGDMSQNQGMLRMHARLSRKPYMEEYCKDLLMPVMDCEYNQKDTCGKKHRQGDGSVWDEDNERQLTFEQAPSGYVPCTYCRKRCPGEFRPAVWYERHDVQALSWRQAYRNSVKLSRRQRKVKMKMYTYPNSTLTVREINSVLNTAEEFENFIPDVILVDYVDIMAPEIAADKRHAEDEKWRNMRALSSTRKACVITPTQADADSYGRETQNMNNYSECKSKYGHLTALLTLNQTDHERALGIMRLAVLLAREGETPRGQAKCLECRSIGRTCLDSYI